MVTYYCCRQGGNKERPHRIGGNVKLIYRRESKKDRTSRLCDCEFQIKIVESKCSSSLVHATIYIQSKHSGHNPESNADFFFYEFTFT